MGEVIRKGAAAADIMSDVHESYLKAVAKKGKWETLADEQISPVLNLFDTFEKQLKDARSAARPLTLARDVAGEKANKLVGKVSDDVWNAVGRPKQDPVLDILFPGGLAFYTLAEVTERPARMDFLAEPLLAGVHPKLDPAMALVAAGTVEAEAGALRTAVETAHGPQAKVAHLERVTLALARSGALHLAAFKRQLKAAGYTEAEIHTVIPDRGKPPAKKPTPAQPPQPPPAASTTPPAAQPPPAAQAQPADPQPAAQPAPQPPAAQPEPQPVAP